MKFFPFLIVIIFAKVAFADTLLPDASAFEVNDWEMTYRIDQPTNERRKFIPPPWKILDLAAKSSRVWLVLSQNGRIDFLEPGLEDGDNPFTVSSAETKRILAAACQVLHSTPDSQPKTEVAGVFTISVELRIGGKCFQYSDRTFNVDSDLPPAVYNLIQTMEPYSPAWTRSLRKKEK